MSIIKLQDQFCVLPTIDIAWINWINKDNTKTKVYDIRFAWLWWMFSTNKIVKFVNEHHYY